MNDYINKQMAIDTLIKEANEYGSCGYVDAFNIEKTLNAMPAVEVIRCKDCKHRDPEDKKCDFGHDIIWQLPRRDDWYCADGERKDG